jgi:hypothetical protein
MRILSYEINTIKTLRWFILIVALIIMLIAIFLCFIHWAIILIKYIRFIYHILF